MQNFYVVEGFFNNVSDTLDFGENYLELYAKLEDYQSDTSVDLGDRAPPVINPFGTTEAVLARLGNYDNLPPEQWYYIQGLWDGRVFSSKPILQLLLTKYEDQIDHVIKNNICFVYVDDEGNDCGFAISYLVGTEHQSPPYAVSIIRKTHHSAPSEKPSTVILHPSLITEKMRNDAKPLESSSVLTKIQQALRSEPIAKIITQLNLFDKNELNLANLNEFNKILELNRVEKIEIFPTLSEEASDLINKSKTKDAAILLGTPLLAAGIGGGVGAIVGSFIPIVGTIFGAIVGAALGGALGVAIDGWQGFIRNRVFGGKHPTIERVSSGALSTIGLAGIGALLGTFVFPGFGTLLGAAVGGGVGLVSSLMIGATRWIQSKRHLKIAPAPETASPNTDQLSALRKSSTPRSSEDEEEEEEVESLHQEKIRPIDENRDKDPEASKQPTTTIHP